MNGRFVGLASGPQCIVSCAPVLVPVVGARGGRLPAASWSIGEFLLGRLAGYLVCGVVAWVVAAPLRLDPFLSKMLQSGAFAFLGLLLIAYGLGATAPASCPATHWSVRWTGRFTDGHAFAPVLGFLTGISPCPPFLLALAQAAAAESLLGSVYFFACFFVGTSVFFLPLPVLGPLGRVPHVRTVARLTALIVGSIYILRALV